MSPSTLIAALVATLLTANFVIAQDSFEPFEDTFVSNESGQLNFSPDAVGIETSLQNGPESTVLFKVDTQTPTLPPVAVHSNAQQEIVSTTLQLIGAALLVSLIVIGTILYSNQRNFFGDHQRKVSQW